MYKFIAGTAGSLLLLATGFAPALANTETSATARSAVQPAATPDRAVLTEAKPGSAAPAADLPWLYEGSDVPVDDSWTFGELPNGLKYAVKKNQVPAGQVAIRVRIDAGSLYEREEERGYAHLLEHLSFRGSEYVPDGESKRIWQRFGVTFGSDSNALTSPTQTVYKLDLPNSSPQKFDESMKILSGMMRAPNIDAKALAAERQIVLAEMRESSGPAREMGDSLRSHFFAGQPLAERSPIGTPKTLNAATVEGLAAFHKRWYRPDKTVIVIAGDVDAPILEASIRKHFGQWQSEGEPEVQPSFGQPEPQDDRAMVYVDPNLPVTANIGYLRPWHKVDDTIVYNQQLLIDLLATNIINRRLAAQARSGASFLYAEVSQDDISRSADLTTVSLSPVASDWEAAIKDVRATIADAVATPPSAADIERERMLFSRTLQTMLDSYPFEAAAKQADEIVRAVDIRETVAAPQTVVDVFENMQGLLTPQRLHDATKRLFKADAVRIFLSTRAPVADGEARLANALAATVKGNSDARLAQKEISFDDLPRLGRPGEVIASPSVPNAFNMELVKFRNGARALLWPNDAESGQIRMLVRFGKGYQAVSPANADLLWTGPIIINENGIGKFNQTQIEQLANGRRLQLNFGVANDAFEYSATTSTADLADQLRLIATKMEHPGWDKAPLARAKAFVKSGYDSYEMSANAVLQRDLEFLLRGGDARWKTPTPSDAANISDRKLKRFWKPLLKSGPVEIILIGDFARDDAVAALANSFGAMKPRKPAAVPAGAAQIAFPKGRDVPVQRTHNGPADQAAATIAWPTGGGIGDVSESRELDVLAAIFRDRLFEKFRAEQAASYSPNMSNYWPIEFDSGGYLIALSLVQPKDVDRFFRFSEQVAADLAANPVSADELSRATEPLVQVIERISTGNTFWVNEIKGATYDRRRFAALGRLLSDYKAATPARIQALAQKYFVPGNAWRMTVMPDGREGKADDAGGGIVDSKNAAAIGSR